MSEATTTDPIKLLDDAYNDCVQTFDEILARAKFERDQALAKFETIAYAVACGLKKNSYHKAMSASAREAASSRTCPKCDSENIYSEDGKTKCSECGWNSKPREAALCKEEVK